MDNSLENKLNELKISYLKKLETIISSFKKNLEENILDAKEIYSQVHTISGTSGMYGYQKISEYSTEFEIYLKLIKESIESLDREELKKKFLEYIVNMEKYISAGE